MKSTIHIVDGQEPKKPEITSEDRRWALNNLGQAMKDLDNDCSEYDLSALCSIKAALTHLGQSDLMNVGEYIPQVLEGDYEEVDGHD